MRAASRRPLSGGRRSTPAALVGFLSGRGRLSSGTTGRPVARPGGVHAKGWWLGKDKAVSVSGRGGGMWNGIARSASGSASDLIVAGGSATVTVRNLPSVRFRQTAQRTDRGMVMRTTYASHAIH